MYCLNCGSQMEEGSKFCIACGAKAENNGAKAETGGFQAEIAPAQETAAQEAAVSVEGTSALAEEPVQTAPKPEPQQPVQQAAQPVPPQPVQQVAQLAQVAQPKPVQSTFTPPATQQPVQQAQPQYNANMQQQAVPQQVIPQKPEKAAPLPVWKFIGIFLIMGIPILGIVMVFVWAFGSSFNRNTRNYARAVLIMALIGLVLTIVGYFTIWANVQEIMNNLMPNSGLPTLN